MGVKIVKSITKLDTGKVFEGEYLTHYTIRYAKADTDNFRIDYVDVEKAPNWGFYSAAYLDGFSLKQIRAEAGKRGYEDPTRLGKYDLIQWLLDNQPKPEPVKERV